MVVCLKISSPIWNFTGLNPFMIVGPMPIRTAISQVGEAFEQKSRSVQGTLPLRPLGLHF
jgi:hypothetical protein